MIQTIVEEPVPEQDLVEAAAAATGLPDGVGAPVVRSALWRSGFAGERASASDLWNALPVLRELLLEHLAEADIDVVMERLGAMAQKAPSMRVPRAPSEPPSLEELTRKLRENNVRMSMTAPSNDTGESVLNASWIPPKIESGSG